MEKSSPRIRHNVVTFTIVTFIQRVDLPAYINITTPNGPISTSYQGVEEGEGSTRSPTIEENVKFDRNYEHNEQVYERIFHNGTCGSRTLVKPDWVLINPTGYRLVIDWLVSIQIW